MPFADVYYVDVDGGYRYHGATELTMIAKFKCWQDRCPSFLANLDRLPVPTAITGRRIDLEDALALEVAETVMSPHWPKSRGGPYCLKRLTPGMAAEIESLQAALAGKRYLQDKIQAVREVASTLADESPLVRHLQNKCYKCSGPFQACGCRKRMLNTRDDHLRDAVAPATRRRTKPISGFEQRRRLIAKGKMTPESDEFKRHKWGPNFVEVRQRLNAKYPNRKGKAKRK